MGSVVVLPKLQRTSHWAVSRTLNSIVAGVGQVAKAVSDTDPKRQPDPESLRRRLFGLQFVWRNERIYAEQRTFGGFPIAIHSGTVEDTVASTVGM